MSNPLWTYSLAVYGTPEVSVACLALQDRCGLDVNLLLYGAWLASLDQQLTAPHLQQVEAAVAQWREQVVLPLRELRRRLRAFAPAEALREEIRVLELRAERHQQDLVYQCHESTGKLPGAARPLRENLALVAALGGAREARREPLVEDLAAALER